MTAEEENAPMGELNGVRASGDNLRTVLPPVHLLDATGEQLCLRCMATTGEALVGACPGGPVVTDEDRAAAAAWNAFLGRK